MKGILLGGALAFGGALIGYLFGAGVDMTKKAAWWDVLTALGTVGATFAAIGIAAWEHHRGEIRRAEERRIARRSEISRELYLIRSCHDVIEDVRNMLDSMPTRTEAIERLTIAQQILQSGASGSTNIWLSKVLQTCEQKTGAFLTDLRGRHQFGLVAGSLPYLELRAAKRAFTSASRATAKFLENLDSEMEMLGTPQ